MQKVKAHLQETGQDARIPDFQKGATQMCKHLLEKFDEIQMFTGESFNMDAGLAYCYYKDQNDDGPTFFFFVDGMKEEKF